MKVPTIICAGLLAAAFAMAAEDDARAQVDLLIRDDSWNVPAELTVRARVAAITPSEPVKLEWRYAGEGLGGEVVRGVLGEKLDVGQWCEPQAVKSIVKGQFPAKLFLTITCGRRGSRKNDAVEGQSKDVEIEFEFSYQNKVLKTFSEKGPDGGTVGIVIPAARLSGGKTPASPEFLDELCGLKTYAQRRVEQLQKAQADARGPKLFSIVTNLGGYGEGAGYGVRYTDKSIVEIECRALRMLGVNGFASAPGFLRQRVAAREGYAAEFSRAIYLQLGGYPVPSAATKGKAVPEAGCPFAPGVAARSAAMIESGIAEAVKSGVGEVWWRTEDEIGAVVDRAPEGKAHLAGCAQCAEGFRAYVKQRGLSPADLGAADWSAVKPLNIFGKEALVLKERGESLNAYHTSMFLNYASAKLFTPLRDALARLNEEKVKAGRTEQPFVYSFALRGNTFLMGGHSLDFFDFYRHADNAFVYETSNRDIRICGWDSYLCDVGRVVADKQKIKFGVYVKPHRGAPIQRTLSAASRNAQMLYWYTYGPDYYKGDSFAEKPSCLDDVARVASLLGKSEEVLYGAKWMRAAEVAVVNPRSSELWARLRKAPPAAYENAKWTYSALQHAHIPVDAIDEGMLEGEDLARYKVIYISGVNLTRAAAEKVAAWVRGGGTLYTSGGGLARDEANQPLDLLQPLMGLQSRKEVELYYKVSAYGATQLERYDEAMSVLAPAPAGAEIRAQAPYASFKPIVGREVLQPAPGAKVLAAFADGGAALVSNSAGQGKVYVAGFFPGLEYSAAVRREDFDMRRDFDSGLRSFVTAAALERGKPVVDASEPLVEGVLLRNEASGKRAVVLMNWAYRVTEKRVVNKRTSTLKDNVKLKDVKITLRGAGAVTGAKSLALDKALQVESTADESTIVISELEEGDVLLLD